MQVHATFVRELEKGKKSKRQLEKVKIQTLVRMEQERQQEQEGVVCSMNKTR